MARGAPTKEQQPAPQAAAGPADPTGRLARQRSRGRGLMVLMTAAVLAVGFGIWTLYGSSWLRIDHVSVSWTGGPEVLSVAEVEAAAAIPEGAPMASLDKEAVRERVRGALPRVRDVEVIRAWPGGVGVRIMEREPAVQLPGDDGFMAVDAEGVPFAEFPEAAPGVPVLDLEPDGLALPGRFGEDRVRSGAASVPGELPTELREEVATVRASSWDTITVELTDGRTVRWGSPEDSEAKRTALEAVLNAAPDARHFNVSVPSAPATGLD